MRRLMIAAVAAALLTGSACTKIYNGDRRNAATLTAPTPTPEPDTIEFRVIGNVNVPVTIRHSNSLDGLSVNAAASLPYYAAIQSNKAAIFLLLEAAAIPPAAPTPTAAIPAIQVQIFVNGQVFRESYATGATAFAQASGTYRQP
jgi:hypothetical protein